MWYDEYIERTEGIQGGEPVLWGTRTPVRTVAILFHVTYPGDINEVREALPHLTPVQIDAALAYYDDHRTEIDGYIAEHERVLNELFSIR